MKILLLLTACCFFFSCGSGDGDDKTISDTDTVYINEPSTDDENDETADETPAAEEPETDDGEGYSNEVFRDVKVVSASNNTWRVTGEARVFEASFSWVVEDGHNQLKTGHDMTDAGAPEWGNFDFTFSLDKAPDPNTTPHLILLVFSAKDGSPTHELPIPLPVNRPV